MANYKNTLTIILAILATILVLVGLTRVNYTYVVNNPGGNDFIPRWLGTRLFLLEGQSPYSDQTTAQIQQMIFGRQAKLSEDQSLFVYPFYSTLIFFPYALISDYDTARAMWMTTLEVSLILLAAASISLSRWRLGSIMLAAVLVFAALWYHSVRPLINGNASIVVALLVTAALLAIRAEQDGLAGFLLALATIKPQVVILLVILVLLWSAVQRRWALFGSFLGSLALLIAATSLFIPNWLYQNVRQVLAYPDYTLAGTPGAILKLWVPGVGSQLGWAITILLAGVLIWEWYNAATKDFHWFLWTACLTLAITNLIGIRTATANYIVMFPALIIVWATWDRDWGVVGRSLILISYLLLFFGLWWLFLTTIQQGDQPIQNPVMFFPFPLFLIIGLYWIRWWYLKPPKPLLDELRRYRRGGLR